MSQRLPTWSPIWLLPIMLWFSWPAQAADGCAIVETVSGDRTLAESIASLLEQHGVHTHVEHCGADRTHVLLDERKELMSVTVTIRDGEGKAARRSLPRDQRVAAVAASLVESFVLGEDRDLLFRPIGPSSEGLAKTKAAPSRWLGQVSLLGGFMIGSDSSTWYGVQLDGCARVGWSCVGVRARFAEDSNGGGISSDLVRTQWEGSGLLGVPFGGSRWQLLPAFALGVSYTKSSLFPAPFRVSVSDYDLRGQVSLGLALFLSTAWAVRIDLAGEGGVALSHASRQRGNMLNSLLGSFIPLPPGQSGWLALGLECRL